MSSWDDLTEAQKARIAHINRRTHSAVNREIALRLEDARTEAFGEAIDFLALSGFVEAAAALEAAAFEVPAHG